MIGIAKEHEQKNGQSGDKDLMSGLICKWR